MSHELIARIESATGPDRELDCRIWCAVERQNFDVCRQVVPNFGEWLAPSYTASIDAALSLVPDGHQWSLSECAMPDRYYAGLGSRKASGRSFVAQAATPALALCAAALKARLA